MSFYKGSVAPDEKTAATAMIEDIKAELDSFGNDPIFENLEARKIQVEELLSKLLRENRELARLVHSIQANEDRFEFEKTNIQHSKNCLEQIVNIDPIKKCEELRILENRYADVEKLYCEVNERANKEKEKVLNVCNTYCSQLKKLKKIFLREHIQVVEKLECIKAKVPISKIAKVQEKINFLKDQFHKEFESIKQFETKLTQLDLSEESSSTSEETTEDSDRTAYSEMSQICFKKCQSVKSNDQKYIQEAFGKAIIDGLAAIHLYQPTDPVYFLAHYLTHYRHNELMYNEKQSSFEELINIRKKIRNYVEDATCRSYECANCQTEFN